MIEEKCEICNYPLHNHSTMCPDNLINSDAYFYREVQGAYDDELTEEDCLGDIGDK